MHCLIFLTLFVTLINRIRAEPANIDVVQHFLDCLQFHNATDYAYKVTTEGELTFAPLLNTNFHADVDLKPFSVCNHIFGLGFYGSFDYGINAFDPSSDLKDIRGVNATDLIDEGLLARDDQNATSFNTSDFDRNNRITQFVAVADSIGFNASEMSSVVGFDVTPHLTKLKKRDT